MYREISRLSISSPLASLPLENEDRARNARRGEALSRFAGRRTAGSAPLFQAGSKRASLALLISIFVLGLAASGSAWASNPSDEGCNQDDECREHFVNGKTLYKQQDYTGALKEFQLAYERRQTPILLANIGRTLQKLGRPKEALDYYQRCQDAAKTDVELQEKLKLYIEETKALLATSPEPSAVEPKKPEPDPQPINQPPPPMEKKTPVYKKGWFWGVIGGATGAVIVAVVVGVVVGTRAQGNPSLPELRF